MPHNTDDALSVLFNFFSAMKRWNDKFYPLMKKDAAANIDQAAAELRPIFHDYVSPDAIRSTERIKHPSTSEPSDYDSEANTVYSVDIKDSKVIVDIQTNTGFRDIFRFTLVKYNDIWKVFQREVFDDIKGAWKSHHI